MAVLHIAHRSPGGMAAWSACLARLGEGDSLLLIEDGVYAGAARSPYAEALAPYRVYLLEPDRLQRGVPAAAGITPVDYAGFVQLAASHEQVWSWS